MRNKNGALLSLPIKVPSGERKRTLLSTLVTVPNSITGLRQRQRHLLFSKSQRKRNFKGESGTASENKQEVNLKHRRLTKNKILD